MKRITKFLQQVDNLAPNPWYVEGVKQARPTTQLGFILGVIVGFIIILCYIL